jgi:hypothetical protein
MLLDASSRAREDRIYGINWILVGERLLSENSILESC